MPCNCYRFLFVFLSVGELKYMSVLFKMAAGLFATAGAREKEPLGFGWG